MRTARHVADVGARYDNDAGKKVFSIPAHISVHVGIHIRVLVRAGLLFIYLLLIFLFTNRGHGEITLARILSSEFWFARPPPEFSEIRCRC